MSERVSDRWIDCPRSGTARGIEITMASTECCAEGVDGKLHSWRFDGDDPHVICHYCGEIRDTLTGRVIEKGASGAER